MTKNINQEITQDQTVAKPRKRIGRPKKNQSADLQPELPKNEELTNAKVINSAKKNKTSKKVSKKSSKNTPAKKEEPNRLGKRNSMGLYDSIEYKYDDLGFIDWKAMIPKCHVFPNKDWFYARKKDIPENTEELSDEQLLIKLAGIKWLARLRGYESACFEVIRSEDHCCVVRCDIDWTPNFEFPNGATSCDIASANFDNCDGFGRSFIECIAANRAFSRCVKNFLNVNIVGDEEMGPYKPSDKDDTVNSNANSSVSKGPASFFLKYAKDKLENLESVISFCKENGVNISDECSDEDSLLKLLDAETCKKLMTAIKKMDLN